MSSPNSTPSLSEFLTFRRMLTPTIIQIVFWAGLAFIAVGFLGLLVADSAGSAILLLLFGPVLWRVYTELLIVIFRIHSSLEEANGSLRQLLAAGGPPRTPPTA